MGKKDKAIDAYIAKSADFAKPILKHIRELLHQACPEVEEKMKWSFPHFDYKGEMMCSMASFKQHMAFGFWKAALMKDPVLVANAKTEQAMGHLGRITSLKDLPSDKKMTAWIKEAMKLNDQGIKVAKPKPAATKELVVPDYFTNALGKNKKARQVFDAASYSYKKEYVMWLVDAKSEETRNSRMVTAIEWIAEGKHRNWKYMKK
ncbi:MAG TPA: YdeI/OmpD-associated family protein [Ferruginibacter sp.]|nr:hypothetical protein [Chitinophagaceae bacterium]HRI23517.1 YdeI/OmpD-associated family protein [Ferruginibacter sp.]